MTSQADIAAVALDPKEDSQCQIFATQKLTDPQLLARIAETTSATRDVRLTALRKIEDQSVLIRIAQHDVPASVTQAILQHLTDQPALAYIAIHHSGKSSFTRPDGSSVDRPVGCDAVARLTAQPLLAQVAIEAPRKDTTRMVRSRSGGGSTYLGVEVEAMRASGGDVTIIGPDDDTPQWQEQVVSSYDVNCAAVAKLDDITLLAKVRTESKEPTVQARVDRRLAELESHK